MICTGEWRNLKYVYSAMIGQNVLCVKLLHSKENNQENERWAHRKKELFANNLSAEE